MDPIGNLAKADKNANFICKARSQNIFLLVDNKKDNTLIDKTNYRDNIQYL